MLSSSLYWKGTRVEVASAPWWGLHPARAVRAGCSLDGTFFVVLLLSYSSSGTELRSVYHTRRIGSGKVNLSFYLENIELKLFFSSVRWAGSMQRSTKWLKRTRKTSAEQQRWTERKTGRPLMTEVNGRAVAWAESGLWLKLSSVVPHL